MWLTNKETGGKFNTDWLTEEKEKTSQIKSGEMYEHNKKYGPDPNDANLEYFKDTSVPVTTSLQEWRDEVEEDFERFSPGMQMAVAHYMDNSSINNKLNNGIELTEGDRRQIHELDMFTAKYTLNPGTMLYSGLGTEESLKTWTSNSEVKYPAYLSTSPDPVYAVGYGLNTKTVLQIECAKPVHCGKTFYESSCGTEAVLGRNTTYKIVGESQETIDGRDVKIIKVRIE